LSTSPTSTKTYLFLISVAPVQSFISEARKTHDLFAGSRILSEMTNEGMKIFTTLNEGINKEKGVVIFPNPENESKPNRFLGEIKGTENELRKLGQKIEEKIRGKFEKFGEDALKKTSLNYEIEKRKNKFEDEKEYQKEREKVKEEFKQEFDNQIRNHLEISWLFEEIKDDDYKTAYKNIETHLEAVKNTRGFDAFTEIGRKCSIDGKNNALLFGNKSKTPFYF